MSTAVFSSTGDGLTPRSGHIAVLLAGDRVMVAGGVNGMTRLSSAELFDAASGMWSATGSMAVPRYGHAAVALRDGRVLVVGGHASNFDCAGDPPVGKSSETYDFTTGLWARTGDAVVPRNAPAAVLLADGRVLVAGGNNRCGSFYRTAEIYNPASGTWTRTGDMSAGRSGAGAVLLADGRVLVAGGIASISASSASLASAEIYDPSTGAWTPTGSMRDGRSWSHEDVSASGALARLPDGRVLTAGGCPTKNCSSFLTSSELFDPASGTWSPMGSLAAGRSRHQLAALGDGRVLVAGGRNGAGPVGSAELFDPATGAFAAAGALLRSRYDFTATLLGDGRVLIAAGHDATTDLRSAELSVPPPANLAPVANAGDAASGTEGAAVAFDGRGSSDPEGHALTFSWDFGDGSAPASGPTPSHVYADNGTYAVRLTVSDGVLSSPAATTAQIANAPPVVAALDGGSVAEGQEYAAHGSFSDPGADSWTATVDYGDGSGEQPLDLSGRAFDLSHVYPAGEAGPFTVTVAVRDDDGGVGSSSASVVVAVNRAPVASVASMVVSGAEGAAVRFDASASSDPDGNPITFSWNFGDGSPLGDGPTPSHVYADNGAYAVRLVVSDGRLSSPLMLTANVANVAPTVTGLPGAELLPGEAYSAVGSFRDPGSDTWTASVDYGDGSVGPLALSEGAFRLSHVYHAPGSFRVTVTVLDDDGGTGSASATVVVLSLQQMIAAIEQTVAGMASAGKLSPGNANALLASLDAALGKLDRGSASAGNQLEAFINKVEAMMRSGKLSKADARVLIDAARRVLDLMGS